MRRFIATFLSVLLVINSFAIAAPTIDKTESVYVNLDYYGEVDQIHVFNDCILTGQNEVADFGVYENLTNLTNRTEVQNIDGKLIWNVDGLSRFAYNGKVSNENSKNIPWSFNISYKLNGVPAKAEDLLGKSGTVEIEIEINANKNADEYYRNNYMLEVTGSYDLNDYLSVESEEAMFITTGRTKTLMHIVLPGQSTTLHIRIGTNNFEMDGLTFAMVPVEGKILEKLGEIVDDKKNLEDAMDELNSSTDIMLSAMAEMNSSLDSISGGISRVQDGTHKLYSLSGERDESIEETKKVLEETQEDIVKLQKDLENAIDSVNDVTNMMEELQVKFNEINKTMKLIQDNLEDAQDIAEDLPDNMIEIRKTIITSANLVGNFIDVVEAEIRGKNVDVDGLTNDLNSIATETGKIGLAAGSITPNTVEEGEALTQIGTSALTIGENLRNVQTALTEIQEIMSDGTSASKSMISNLKSMQLRLKVIADMIDEEDGELVIDVLDNMEDMIKEIKDVLEIGIKYNQKAIDSKENIPTALENMKNLLKQLNKLDELLVSLLKTTQKSLKIIDEEIYEGTDKMMTGIVETTDNIKKITNQSNNIKSSKNVVRNVIKDNWNEIDEETTIFNIDVNAKPKSFLSSRNEAPSKVQFMIKTQDIKEIKDIEKDLEAEKDNGSLWSRIYSVLERLFGWIFKLFGNK